MNKESSDTTATEVDIYSPSPPIVIRVDLNGKPIEMEIDTGATVSKQKFKKPLSKYLDL